MKRRLFWKILLAFWLTFFLIVQGIWLMFMFLRSEPSDFARSMAKMSVAAASAAIRTGGEPGYRAEVAGWLKEQKSQIELRSATAPAGTRPVMAQADASSPDGTRYRITYYRQSQSRGLFNIPREVVIAGAAGGLLFSALLAWYLTQPVERMRAGFRRLAQGNFTTRLAPAMGRRRDEIADLAHDFDQMAAQLQELVAARDRLLADVSHELRTPLARLNLAIALARQDPDKIAASLDRVGQEAAKLDEMVGELLTLSKLETGQRSTEDYFDFAELAKAVIQDAGYEAAAKQVSVVLQGVDDSAEWIARGNGRLVSRAVENIVRNAVRYSPQGAQVTMVLHRDADFFRLVITDCGPGIPDDQLGQLFKPFALSADGFGFGLGLAIAQRAIAVNGGAIAARNRQAHDKENGGLEMTVTLPAARLERV
jgi:two-component system OmpR family sensor kinase